MPFSVAYLLIVGCVVVLNVGLSVLIWLHRRTPGALYITLACLCVAQVGVMFMLMTVTDSPEVGYAVARLRFIGLAFVGPAFLMFTLIYTQRGHLLTPRNTLLLFVLPVLTQVVLWSPAHTAFFAQWELNTRWEWSGEVRTFGFWFYIHAAYSLATFLTGIVVVVRHALRVDSSRRGFVLVVLVGSVIGLPAVTFPFTLGPSPGLLITPVALGVITGAIAWAFLRYTVLSLMPVAYDLVFSSMDESVVVTDAENVVLNANPAAVRLFERPLEKIVRRPVAELMADVTNWPEGEPPPEPFEVVVTSCGEALTCRVIRLPMLRGGEPIGYLIVLRDVTAELKAFDVSLEQERSRLLVSFIADASHEFRTPLSIIKSCVFLMGKQADATEKTKDYLGRINAQADRIDLLVNDLQTMSRLDSDKALERVDVNLTFIVTGLLDGFVYPRAAEKNIGVSVELAPALPRLKGSPDDITLALRYTPPQGTVRINAARDGERVRIMVSDSGIGMNDETARMALRRFFRADSARTIAGFGLGLPITQRIVENHGGELDIASAPDSGTSVTLILPLEPPA